MSPILVGVIGLAVFFLFLFIGLPVVACMLLVGIGGIALMTSMPAALNQAATSAFSVITSYDFATLPLFIFMAEIISHGKLSTNIYEFFRKTVGRIRGGLAMATVGFGATLGAMIASSLATAALMAIVSNPEMEKSKYDKSLAAGSIVASSGLALMIPPSALLILYGVLTGTSILKLFAGGIVPGILLGILFMVVIYIQCLLKPNLGPSGPKFGIKEIYKAFGSSWDGIFLMVFCIGGMLIGWFTPTEAGAVGAAGSLIVATVKRSLTWQQFREAIFGTLTLVGMMYGIMMGAFIFMSFTALSTIPTRLGNFVVGLNLSPFAVMAIIIFFYLALGTFMEEGTMIMVTIPIFFPLSLVLGFDPVWFGIIIVLVMIAGGISPPTGMIMFTVAKMLKIPITTMYRGVWPFFLTEVLFAFILLFVPAIVTWLPGLISR